MTAKPDVHTLAELEGEERGMRALQERRAEASMDLAANRTGFDLLALDDEKFAALLAEDKKRQARLREIIENRLSEKVHYGKVPGVQKPFLWLAGAEELQKLFRFTPRHVADPIIVATEDYVSATVRVGVFDSAGRHLASRSGNCNTREKRFQKRGGTGFIYTDAREQVHGCVTMAEKRAIVLAMRAATGTTGFFANPEEMDEAIDADDPALQPWTPEEEAQVKAGARELGIKTRPELFKLFEEVLGEEWSKRDFTSADAAKLLEAIAQRQAAKDEPGHTPLKQSPDPYAPTPAPEPKQASEAERPGAAPAAAQDDLGLDRGLVEREGQ